MAKDEKVAIDTADTTDMLSETEEAICTDSVAATTNAVNAADTANTVKANAAAEADSTPSVKRVKKPYMALVPFLLTGAIWIIGAVTLPVNELWVLLCVLLFGAVAFVIASYSVSKRTHLPPSNDNGQDEPDGDTSVE